MVSAEDKAWVWRPWSWKGDKDMAPFYSNRRNMGAAFLEREMIRELGLNMGTRVRASGRLASEQKVPNG